VSYKLVGSHGTLEDLRKRIENYYFTFITLKEVKPREWSVWNTTGQLTDVRVIEKNKRFRFERKVS
jgi:hypothetical protein